MEEFIVFIVFFAICGIVIYAGVRSIQKAKKISAEKQEKASARSAHIYGTIKHYDGLPFPGGVMVEMYYGKDAICFTKDNQEVTLDRIKVVNMDVCSGKDLKANSSSGAVGAGFLLAGATGAAIGALAASGTYLVISYKKDEELKLILLDTFGTAIPIQKLIKDFKAGLGKEVEKIEL